jgi:hypothetical protein
VEDAIRKHLRAGNGILKVTAMVGCGSGTVQRVRREMVEELMTGCVTHITAAARPIHRFQANA